MDTRTAPQGSTVDLSELEYKAQTATVRKYYAYHDADRKAAARAALRRVAKCDGSLHKEDGMADVAWKYLVVTLMGRHRLSSKP